jgi:phenylacetate-CoA ligase
VVTKEEMSEDATEHPPMGTYQTIGPEEWSQRGWMQFSTSGSTGVSRAFRYTHIDRGHWAWANVRALQAMRIGRGETVLLVGGFGPHVWLWGVYEALMQMQASVLSGGGLDGTARARTVERFKPTVLACTPSYALHLGHVMQELGLDPAASSVRTLFLGGEPAVGIPATRQRLEALWNARTVEFYGCTEASPHAGGFSCDHSDDSDHRSAHLLEDVQIWEVVDPSSHRAVPDGERGLTVCTSLNSESSPQLRFLVGDFTTLSREVCACGRSHVRAMGSFAGRADDVLNVRGIKFFPIQIEQAVRALPGSGDEFEIVLSTSPEGLDVLTVRIEHPGYAQPASMVERLANEIRSRCEIRAGIEVLAPGSLPRTQFKARRVRDTRGDTETRER